jgi:hypothetical protein
VGRGRGGGLRVGGQGQALFDNCGPGGGGGRPARAAGAVTVAAAVAAAPLQLGPAGGSSGATAAWAASYESGRPAAPPNPQYGWAGFLLAQMICQAPVTAAIMMAAVRLRDSLNEDTFRETYSLHPSTADYNSLHQITSDYFVITFSYSLFIRYFLLQIY